MAFTNRREPTEAIYFLNNVPLLEIDCIKDLGVTYDFKFKFDVHIDLVTKKAFRMLGFITRMTKYFDDTKCISMLYR